MSAECLPFETDDMRKLFKCKRGVVYFRGDRRVMVCHPCSEEEELMAVLGTLL